METEVSSEAFPVLGVDEDNPMFIVPWQKHKINHFRKKLMSSYVMPRIRDPQRPPRVRVRCKSKEPLFELAPARSPTCTDAGVRYQGERASFKSTKVLLGPRGSW